MMTLKRPRPGNSAPAPTPAPTPEVKAEKKEHPFHTLVSKKPFPPAEDMVRALNGSPWVREIAAFAVKLLEHDGFKRDAEADKARGDGTAVLTKETDLAFFTFKIKANGEKIGAYYDILPKTLFKIKVRQYITKEPTEEFDFHTRYNDGKPVPMRTMYGYIIGETKGMYKLSLHAKPEATITCMCCGRTLTNEMSQKYGIGPICIQKYGAFAPPLDDEELEAKKEELTKFLADIKWTGFVPKKSVELMEEIEHV